MKSKLYVGRLPRRGEDKKTIWNKIKTFSDKYNTRRINVCRPSANKLVYNNEKIKANLLAPAYSPQIKLNFPKCLVINVTALWKYSKVHESYFDPKIRQPTKEWFDRRQEGWKYGTTKKHLPRGTPYSRGCNVWFLGKQLDFIVARKEIWIEYYKKIYQQQPVYLALKKLYKDNNILLLDFSCSPEHHLMELNKDAYLKIINNPQISLGHSYILYGMLMDWI